MRRTITLLLLLWSFHILPAQNYKFGKVSKEEVMEVEHPLEKDSDAAFLYKEHKVYYQSKADGGFVLVTEVHERIKIYNKDGFDWANKEIQYFRNGSDKDYIKGIKGYTYNLKEGKLVEEKLRKDGIFEDEEVNKYRLKTTLAMPDVKEGSVIEYRYTIESPFLVSIDEIQLQHSIPIKKLEVEVNIPEYLNFRRHFNIKSPLVFDVKEQRKNSSILISASNTVGFIENVYSISKENIPGLQPEPYVDYLKNYSAYLNWELQYTAFYNSPIKNYSVNWEGVTSTIYDEGGYERELNRSGYFKDDIDELLQGITDPREKTAVIFNFLRNKVKWNKYNGFLPENGCRSAYKEGEGNVGDINLMLTAMLKYAGVNAHPVLVSTQENGIPLFPTRNGFNYVISGLKLDGELILLDATDSNAAFGEIPERARNWQGRIVTSGSHSAWVDLMPKTKSVSRTFMNLQLGQDLKITGKLMDSYSGLYAKSYRDNYEGVNQEKYLEFLEQDKGNISISELKTENEKLIGEDIKQTFVFDLEDEVEVINDRIYFQPLLFEAIDENPFKAAERKYPIFFSFPSVIEKVVNVQVPQGYEVESLPESTLAELQAGAGSFKYIVVQNGNFLRISTILDLNTIFYNPTEYEALKNFYGHMVTKQTEAIVFKKI